MRRRSGGKGKSPEQARASALAESLERYCGVFDGTEPRVRASFADLGDAAIHPNACLGYSDRQYAERDSHNRRDHKAHWVPEPFREDVEIEWTPLWSLSAGADPLPANVVLLLRLSQRGSALCTCRLQRVRRGFGPRGSRPSRISRAGGARRRRHLVVQPVDDDPQWISRARTIPTSPDSSVTTASWPRDLWALDVTSDLGVPTFAAISRRVDARRRGCHLWLRIASRSRRRVDQSVDRGESVAGGGADCERAGIDAQLSRRPRRPSLVAHRQDCGRRLPGARPRGGSEAAAGLRAGRFRRSPRKTSSCCQRIAAARGIEILVLDQTRPDVGLPVVRVVAPGLRHFWARFGPGRLYDVPVQQGWLPRAVQEGELNPFVVQF